MSELVRVLSRRAQAGDWRPHTHDALHRLDHHFDSCFNAVLRCESYVQSLYSSTSYQPPREGLEGLAARPRL